ncbi:aspartic peptidase A1 [Athelia psychrophila]|uniref:Aspartic peptidase A1 n=1 Tax=Athelia psychrophila TaxID=1759441 RepID=A0A166UM02_9AGAM|nr:aspartic peptidase A1 [Fibularhizoctonia sp. CBS 109695]
MLAPVNLTVLLAALIIGFAAETCEARLAPSPPSRVAIPIRRLAGQAESSLHPAIVTAQHVNRAHKRLAKLTGRAQPPTHDLVANIHRAVANLPPALQKRYTASEGFSPVDAAASVSNALAPANAPSFAHSVGLAIEGNDIGYVGDIMIGTPPRAFRMLMDSGSSDLWVGSESCSSDGSSDCGNHTFLGPMSSSSFKELTDTWSITYASGQVTGKLAQDNVAFGDLKLTNHVFGVAHNESSDYSANDIPLDGILGLGRKQLANQNTATMLDAMRQSGLIQQAIVSYKIPRLADQQNDGEITLGAMNPSKFTGSVVTFPNVNTQGFWEGAMGAFKVDGKDMGLVNRTGVLDTGTTLLVGPPADVKAIHAAIPGSRSTNGVDWIIPCTTTSVLSLSFGGQDWTVDARDLSFLPVDLANPKGDCTSAISGASPFGGATEWLVGDVFLKNVYLSTNADTNQISLARLS